MRNSDGLPDQDIPLGAVVLKERRESEIVSVGGG